MQTFRRAAVVALLVACGNSGSSSDGSGTDAGSTGDGGLGAVAHDAAAADDAGDDGPPPEEDAGAPDDASSAPDTWKGPVDAGLDAAGELASYCKVLSNPVVRECDPSVTVHCTTDAGAVVWSCSLGTLNPCSDFATCCVNDGAGGNDCRGHTTHLCSSGAGCLDFPGTSCQFDPDLDAGVGGMVCSAPSGAP